MCNKIDILNYYHRCMKVKDYLKCFTVGKDENKKKKREFVNS